MNPYIEIAGRKIGPDYPPLVIAEIGLIMKASSSKRNGWMLAELELR
jgi:hypothetical protein